MVLSLKITFSYISVTCFLGLSLFYSTDIFSQKVQISIVTENDSLPITHSLPFQGKYLDFANEFSSYPKNNVAIFTIDSLTKPCFVTFKFNKHDQIHLIIEPFDSLNLSFLQYAPRDTRRERMQWVKFHGKKGEILRLLNQDYLRLDSNAQLFKSYLNNNYPENTNAYFLKIATFLQNRFSQIDSLCKLYNTTENFNKIVKSAVVNSLLAAIETNINGAFFDSSNGKSLQIHDELRISLFERFQLMLEPFMMQTPLGVTTYDNYMWQKEGSKLDDSEDHNLILPISSGWQGLRTIKLYSNELQMLCWASNMISANEGFPNYWDMKVAFKKYCIDFPKSPYISILKRKL